MSSNQFTGFFPNSPVWVDPIPTSNDLAAGPTLLASTALAFDGDGYEIRVARDGMILFRDEAIEAEIGEIDETWTGDLALAKSHDSPWAAYLIQLNCLYLALECVMHMLGKRNNYIHGFAQLDRADLRRISFDDQGNFVGQITYASKHTRPDAPG